MFQNTTHYFHFSLKTCGWESKLNVYRRTTGSLGLEEEDLKKN